MNSSGDVALQNPMFLEYGGDGFKWTLFLSSLFYATLATVGIPLNFSVCWITYKYSTLRSNTSILLALASFFEILHQSGHFIFLAIAATGTNFIEFRLALILEAHSIVGLVSALSLLPQLSADRLLAVVAPIFYHNMNQRVYIATHLLTIFASNLLNARFFVEAVQQMPTWPVTGYIADLYQLPIPNQNFAILILLLAATILVYALIGVLLKCKTQVTNARMNKLYRSLFLIVLINVGGYFIGNLVIFLWMIGILQFTPVQFWFVNTFTGIFVNLAGGANAIILYKNSNDYKTSYLSEFERLKKYYNNAIHPIVGNSQSIRVMPVPNQN